jgi:hypothetical protein
MMIVELEDFFPLREEEDDVLGTDDIEINEIFMIYCKSELLVRESSEKVDTLLRKPSKN